MIYGCDVGQALQLILNGLFFNWLFLKEDKQSEMILFGLNFDPTGKRYFCYSRVNHGENLQGRVSDI